MVLRFVGTVEYDRGLFLQNSSAFIITFASLRFNRLSFVMKGTHDTQSHRHTSAH